MILPGFFAERVDFRARVRPTIPIIATVLWLPGAAASAFMSLMSVMLFDAPGSENNPWLLVAVGGIVGTPVLCVVSVAASWVVFYVRRDKVGGGLALPLIVAALPLISIAIAVAGFVLLQVLCGGSTRC